MSRFWSLIVSSFYVRKRHCIVVTWVAYDEFLNTVAVYCFRQFALLLVFVPQFQTISSDWFANIKADFILTFHFYTSTEFPLCCLIVKSLQHATESNQDQQRCWITHCRLVYTGAAYDLPHSSRIKVKKTTAKTDRTSTYVTLEMECDAFYFFSFSFSLKAKISFLLKLYLVLQPKGGSGTPGTLLWLFHWSVIIEHKLAQYFIGVYKNMIKSIFLSFFWIGPLWKRSRIIQLQFLSTAGWCVKWPALIYVMFYIAFYHLMFLTSILQNK